MKLEVSIADVGSNWAISASDPAIHGTVAASAATREAALRKFRSALRFHLEGLREDGEDVPAYSDIELPEPIEA